MILDVAPAARCLCWVPRAPLKGPPPGATLSGFVPMSPKLQSLNTTDVLNVAQMRSSGWGAPQFACME
jgi:hypothetical protein